MKSMLKPALAAAIAALALAAPAAANDTVAQTVQKTAENTHDKDVKPQKDGDARPAHEPQTHKMVRCNEEAGKKQLRGDERRAFMSACLKG